MATARLDAHAPVDASARTVRAQASVDTQDERHKRDVNDPGPAPDPANDDTDELDPFDPGDDSDLGLDAADDDDEEDVGLDTSLGFDDTSDDLDLPGLTEDDENEDDQDEDDDSGWEADFDDAADWQDADAELDTDQDEYGWVDEDDGSIDDDQLDDELEEEPAGSGDDGGAEGLEDDSDIDELELTDLPELDDDGEEEVGLPGMEGTEGLDDLVGFGLLDEPMVEIAPGQTCKMLRARATRLTRIVWPVGSAVRARACALDARAMATHGDTLFVASGGLYRLDAQAASFSVMPLQAAEARAVAVSEHEGVLHLAVLAGAQLCVSEDAGRSFGSRPAPLATWLGATHCASGVSLWWSTADGQLCSDGHPALLPVSQGQIVALHADGRRSVAWLAHHEREWQLTASQDAGKSFASWALPALGAAADSTAPPPRVETCGDAVLLSAAGEPLCGVHGGELRPVATAFCEPATLADEEGEPFVYACVAREDEWLVVRRAVRAGHAAPLVLTALERHEHDAPLALAAGYGEGGLLSIFLAFKDGIVRIEASLDGEELA